MSLKQMLNKQTSTPGSSNPFLQPVERVEAEPELDFGPVLGNRDSLAGAVTDAPHKRARLVLVPTGGGVGVSTILTHCQSAVEETSFSELEATDNAVLVASVAADSLRRAEEMIMSLRERETALVGLVLISHRRTEDIPSETKAYAKRIARLCPRTFEVRYEKTWPDQPIENRLPSRLHRRRFRALIRRLDQWKQAQQSTGEDS